MVELTFPASAAARPLFADLEFHLPVTAFFAGDLQGRIYVDDPARPQAALVVYKNRLRLAGRADFAAFNTWLAAYLRENAPRGQQAWLAFPPAPEWEPVLQAGLASCKVYRSIHQYFELLDPDPAPPIELPAGFRLLPVDQALLESSLEGLDSVKDEMYSERISVEDFLEHSLGVCLVHEGAVAGWCMSEYNSGERCEIGIATYEPHRRQGLALQTARALMSNARRAGIRKIGWHCHKENIPSAAAARSLGYALVKEYQRWVIVENS